MIDVFVWTADGKLKCADGYKLKNGMTCNKSLYPGDKSWNVNDAESGLLIKRGLKKLADCMDYAKEDPDHDRLEEAKKTDFYKRMRDQAIKIRKEKFEMED